MDARPFGAAWRADRHHARSPFLWGLASFAALLLGFFVHAYFIPVSPILAVTTLIFYSQQKGQRDGTALAGLIVAVLSLLLIAAAIEFAVYVVMTAPPGD
jgi:hypothetical protein